MDNRGKFGNQTLDDGCSVPRWQMIKEGLNNLNYDAFVEAYPSDKNGVCLDARTPQEFEQGHLEGAININYLSHDLASELEKLPKDKTYYVCCRSGRRSLRICVLLKNMGYTVYNLDGGMRSE